MRYILNIDGASRGNPGPSAAGVLLRNPKGEIIEKSGVHLGEATNNVAEYSSLIIGLKLALKHDVKKILVRSDSELVVRQMTGEYKINSDTLRKLASEAASLVRQFESVKYESIPREKNAEADKIANEALDNPMGASQKKKQ